MKVTYDSDAENGGTTREQLISHLGPDWTVQINGTDYTIRRVSTRGLRMIPYAEDRKAGEVAPEETFVCWKDIATLHVY